ARKGIDAVFIRLCRPLSAAVQVAGGNCGAGDGSAGGVGDVACQTGADFLSQRRADKCKFGKKNGKKVSTQGSASHVGGYYTSIHACVEHAHPGVNACIITSNVGGATLSRNLLAILLAELTFV